MTTTNTTPEGIALARAAQQHAMSQPPAAMCQPASAMSQPGAPSIDTAEFRNLLGDMLDAYRKEMQGGPALPYELARPKLIAHIDSVIAAAAQPAPDYCMENRDLARRILVFMGRATSGSNEPGSDPLADHLAEKLAGWIRPAPAVSEQSGNPGKFGSGAVSEQAPTDLSKLLREYASNPGYSHNEYADTMRSAADEIERCAARAAVSEQALPDAAFPASRHAIVLAEDCYTADQMRKHSEACARHGWDSCASANQDLVRQLRDQIDRAPATSAATPATEKIEAIADELEEAASNYEGDFADTVTGCVEALRALAAQATPASAPQEADAGAGRQSIRRNDAFISALDAYMDAVTTDERNTDRRVNCRLAIFDAADAWGRAAATSAGDLPAGAPQAQVQRAADEDGWLKTLLDGVKIKAFRVHGGKDWMIAIRHPRGDSFVRMNNHRDYALAQMLAAPAASAQPVAAAPRIPEPSRASRIECALRQIVEADDSQALTQVLIESARSALAAPVATAPADSSEAAELLDSLIYNIDRSGNYSVETTLTFLNQIKQCLAPAAPVAQASTALADLWMHEDMDRVAAAAVATLPRKDLQAAHKVAVDDLLHWRRRALTAEAAPVAQADDAPTDVRLVFDEVARATRKFPTWPTDPLHAVAVLGEEFGELTKAVLQATYEPYKVAAGELRTEAIQTAAMALRFVASLERYKFTRCAQHEQPAMSAQQNQGGGDAN